MIWVWVALIMAFVYGLLILQYLYHWIRLPSNSVPKEYSPYQYISIILVARNAAASIGACLRGLLQQRLPAGQMEIIVVDDHSTDDTIGEIKKMGSDLVQLFQLKDYPEYIQAPAFKKSGITLGVEKSRFEHILVTDADCVHPPDWLKTVMYGFEKNQPAFQASPVILSETKSWLGKMQEMEQLTLMLISGAGLQSRFHDMASGANMAFSKSGFSRVNGYEGNFHYASGDDMFLVEKMRAAFPEKISFVKSLKATVYTESKKNWSSLIQQRLRWAGKNTGLQKQTISRIWAFVGLYHVLILSMLLLAILHLISWWPFIILLTIKWIADFLLVSTAASFFKRRSLLVYFIPLQVMYTYYILWLGVAMIFQKKGDWQREE